MNIKDDRNFIMPPLSREYTIEYGDQVQDTFVIRAKAASGLV